MKGISEIIKENFPNGIKNLTVIDPELRINTYQLFPYIDLGVIYTGTLGLEMMLSDVPVISVGTTSHYGLGFSIEPSSLGEYQDALIGNVTKNIDKRELSLYAYFYFLKTVIPWKLTEQVYGNNFSGFEIKNLNDLLPGKDNYLDHLCDCILGINDKVPENW
jgi:hypothetical protein